MGAGQGKPGDQVDSTGEGIGPLLDLVEGRLGAEDRIYEVFLDPGDGQGQAWFHDRGEVLGRKSYQDGRVCIKVRLTEDRAGPAMLRPGSGGSAEDFPEATLRIGEVELGNASPLETTVLMISAQRSFDASMQAIQTYRSLDQRAAELGRTR